MEGSNARVLSFSSKEATEALVAHAKTKGIDVGEYGAWEVRITPQTDKVHCILFAPTVKTIVVVPQARGDA